MSTFNSDFWEVSAESGFLENLPADRGLWFETQEDRDRREVFSDFFAEVKPTVLDLIDTKLTNRQMEVVKLYYLYEKTQEDIGTGDRTDLGVASKNVFATVPDAQMDVAA